MRSFKEAAFTLVELAIVIVIIGLLVGGVLQGQELIKQAKIRNIIKQYEQIKAAHFTFYGKYNCYPGDCPRAAMFFNQTECDNMTRLSNPCNGNGNGLVDNVNWGFDFDSDRYFIHLGLANLLPYKTLGPNDYAYYLNNYNGGSSVFFVASGNFITQVDSSVIAGDSTNAINYYSTGKNYLFFTNHASGVSFDLPSIAPDEAFGIDSKTDDGKPLTGVVFGGTGSYNNTVECVAAGEYRMSINGRVCNMALQID